MQIRNEFLKYVAQRTQLSPEQVAKGSFEFKMDTGEPEDRLAATADIFERFSDMAKDSHAKMEAAAPGSEDSSSYFQLLFNTLPKDPKTLAGDPSKPNSVIFGLRAEASDKLDFGVREHGAKEPENGIFWTPLHQEVVNIDDFAADSPAQTRPKALLFVDTTPGEDGGTAFLHPLFPLAPKLSEAEMTPSKESATPDAGKVRPEVRSRLEAILQADGVGRGQPSDSSINNDYFYTFYKGKEKTAVLRLGLGEQTDFFKPLVPGITDLESPGTVSFARHADQEYAEQIPLNGEERKALLATLSQAGEAIPEPRDGQLLSEQEQRDWHNKQVLGAAGTTLSALVSDGDLGFYEQLVSDLDLKGSWLARLKAGENPRDVF